MERGNRDGLYSLIEVPFFDAPRTNGDLTAEIAGGELSNLLRTAAGTIDMNRDNRGDPSVTADHSRCLEGRP